MHQKCTIYYIFAAFQFVSAPKSPPAPPPPREGAASIYRLSQIVPESQATFRISSAPPKPASSRHIEVSTNSPERSAPKPEATLVNVSPAPGHLSAIEAAFQTLPELEGTRCASPAAPNVAELQPTAQGACKSLRRNIEQSVGGMRCREQGCGKGEVWEE